MADPRSELLVCTWRRGGHVGGQEQKHFSPVGTKLYFHVNFSRKNSSVSTPNMVALSRPCHVVANPRNRNDWRPRPNPSSLSYIYDARRCNEKKRETSIYYFNQCPTRKDRKVTVQVNELTTWSVFFNRKYVSVNVRFRACICVFPLFYCFFPCSGSWTHKQGFLIYLLNGW